MVYILDADQYSYFVNMGCNTPEDPCICKLLVSKKLTSGFACSSCLFLNLTSPLNPLFFGTDSFRVRRSEFSYATHRIISMHMG